MVDIYNGGWVFLVGVMLLEVVIFGFLDCVKLVDISSVMLAIE